jgi:hypothetical protein
MQFNAKNCEFLVYFYFYFTCSAQVLAKLASDQKMGKNDGSIQ